MLPEGVKMTPMLRQYTEWKERYPDCLLFFRMGDFYEMFFDDARTAAEVLDIALTARDPERRIPMAGVPVHAVDSYLGRLVRGGHRVAICEQIGDPQGGGSLVERRVVRVVTPGTYVPDEGGSEGRLAAVSGERGSLSLALLVPAVGTLEVGTLPEEEALATLSAFSPQEILVPERPPQALSSGGPLLPLARPLRRDRRSFDPLAGGKALAQRWQIASVESHGVSAADPAVGCAAAALEYLEETQFTAAAHVARLLPLRRGEQLFLDVTTQKNLELVDGGGATLYGVLHRCRTSMGRRTLEEWILRPSRNMEVIQNRQGAVGWGKDHQDDTRGIQDLLGRCRDVERSLGRLVLGVAGPRDLGAVRDTLAVLPDLRRRLADTPVERATGPLPDLSSLREELLRALEDDLPRHLREGRVVREGYDPELDEGRRRGDGSEAWLAAFLEGERERTGLRTLKAGYNKVFGYYLEVSRSQAHRVPPTYHRKQTLVGVERYITDELKAFEGRMASAEERVASRERELYEALENRVRDEGGNLQILGKILARTDVLLSLGEVAWERRYVCPRVVPEGALLLKGARHPVVEKALAPDPYTPNDVRLGAHQGRIALVTGPNMAGKSTYLRMAALHVILAQMGSFVPAEEAQVPLADRIFTRIGARDELDRGHSTFMVEMIETASILHNLTDASLVVLDEIGRGTSTYDGMSIAWAVLEYLERHCGCSPKVLFATHYHELTRLGKGDGVIHNYSMAVEERPDGIVFLHRVVPHPADRSYGIEVARRAGIPDVVVQRARELLETLEKGAPAEEVERIPSSQGRRTPGGGRQLVLGDMTRDALLEELASFKTADITPFQAQELLVKLRRRARDIVGGPR